MSASCSRLEAKAAIDQEVLAARESAWRAYFGGDVKALGDLLPQEFIEIGMTDGPFGTGQTLTARAFRERGGRSSGCRFLKRRDSGLVTSSSSWALRGGDSVDGAERTLRGVLPRCSCNATESGAPGLASRPGDGTGARAMTDAGCGGLTSDSPTGASRARLHDRSQQPRAERRPSRTRESGHSRPAGARVRSIARHRPQKFLQPIC
jgi:hypothetical protein